MKVLFAWLALVPSLVASKAILGVDLGSLYMKVALVQRGAPLEIVTNLHSKRKTENMVLFDSNTRFYGADANSLYGRKAKKTPSSMSVFLGRPEDHPSVQALQERHFPILPKYNKTRAGVYLTVEGQEFTPEELVAMVLTHAKDITVAYGVEKGNTLLPKDIVLTVPSFATQHERRALMDAAELAGLNVLALIDENTAAALHYGMDKVMEKPKILIFFNMGASALQVSVVKFLSYKHKDSKYSKEKTVGGLMVLGKAWDASLGGLALDHRIVEYLADEFNAKWGKGDVRTVPRAMAKLRIQANKVKHVLSANSEIPIYMESLHDDITLQTKLSRKKLEELCGDLFERVTTPIEAALNAANVTLDEVDGIELIGGGMRVPRVQQEVKSYLQNKMALGMHINSDESMALGAAFHGANISTAFKVRHVGLADVNPFPMSIALNALEPEDPKKAKKKDDEEEVWEKQATLFKAGGKMGIKRTIAFHRTHDVHCSLDYEESEVLPDGTSLSIAKYNISGIEKFASDMEEKGLGEPKVSLVFELSLSGVTQLIKAEASVEEIVTVQEEIEVDDDEEEEEEGSKNETDATEAEAEAETKDAKEEEKKEEEKKEEESDKKDDEASETNETAKEDGDAKKDDKKKKKKKKKKKLVDKEKKKVHKRSLSVEAYHVGPIQPYSPTVMAESTAKMDELARKDKERVLLESSRNKVESYIYHIKNKLADDEERIGKVSTEEQRETIRKLALDAEEWLYDEGYNADLATMEDKYGELSGPAEKIFFRVSEMTARPEAMKNLNEKLGKIKALVKKWEKSMPQVTEEERTDVLEKVSEVEKWMAEMESEQEKADPTEIPVFNSADVPAKSKPIEVLVTRLSRKPKPKPEKKKNETKAENATNTTEEEIHVEPDNSTIPEDSSKEEGETTEDDAKPGAEL